MGCLARTCRKVLAVFLPETVHCGGETLQALASPAENRFVNSLRQSRICFISAGSISLTALSRVVRHPLVGDQEMPDLPVATVLSHQAPARGPNPSHSRFWLSSCALVNTCRRAPMRLLPRDKLAAEPGNGVALIDGVEPEGYLCQLDGHRIAVHPVDAVVSEVSLHFLLFEQVVVMPDHPAGLALFAFQICIGQLIHGFVQEGAAAEGGLADVQA